MPKKKPEQESFQSFQILSDRAHALWAKAKSRMHQPKNGKTDQKVTIDPHPPHATVWMEVPMGTVAKATITVLAVIVSAWLMFLIRDKLLLLIVAAFLSIVIDVSVRWLERLRIPRGMAVLLVYIAFLALAVFLVASLIPIVAQQLQELARFINQTADSFIVNPEVSLPFLSDAQNAKLSGLIEQILRHAEIRDRTSALFRFGQNLSTVAQTLITLAVQVAGSVFNFLASLILILFLTFFIQLEREKISEYTRWVVPRRYRGYYDLKADAIYHKISQWFRGQLILCITIGTLVFIALTILGMDYALTLALLAGFTEFIPYVGPLIAAIPAVLIAFTQDGFVWALVIAGVYYVVQSCENNLIVPLVMKHTVGLSPIAVLFGMLVGISFPDTVHPVLGIILAVPTTTIITIFLADFLEMRRRS